MNYIGDRDADKAFLFIFSTPTCKALACSFYLVSFSLGCAGTLTHTTTSFLLFYIAVYSGKMLLSMYPWRRRRTMMASLQDIYEFDQRLKELL